MNSAKIRDKRKDLENEEYMHKSVDRTKSIGKDWLKGIYGLRKDNKQGV